jgi:hypothetical protein
MAVSRQFSERQRANRKKRQPDKKGFPRVCQLSEVIGGEQMDVTP